MTSGPRIYNLFPLLVGSIEAWRSHLPRIAGMGFDWVFLNPVHYPGFSGSLYAIKDPYRLHDLFAGGEADHSRALQAFIDDARRNGVRVMMDLVVNHTSKDALLVGEHGDWYRRDPAGKLVSPSAVDPNDASIVTVWGDLAELDYRRGDSREGLARYWSEYLTRYMKLGVAGFRCDAAYKVPADIWSQLIRSARKHRPEAVFFAETLGSTVEQIADLREAGFDYFFNSSKWWDFRADWLLDQYERFRTIAPSVSFPESHDTERLAATLESADPVLIARLLKLRYLFAATFSTGVMMPIGYEYGFRRRLDVVATRPADWEDEHLDLSGFIAATNAMKADIPMLNGEGPQRRISAPHAPYAALLRETDDRGDGSVLLLINPDPHRACSIEPGPILFETGGRFSRFEDVTPHASPIRLVPGQPFILDAFGMRVFRDEPVRPPRRPSERSEKVSEKRLERLARERVVIESVWPELDGGRHPVKRVVGDVLEVWADIFCDGHEHLRACLKYRAAGDTTWTDVPMRLFDNDRWVGRIPLLRNGRTIYTIEAWRDLFETWRTDLVKKRDAGLSVSLELVEGRKLVETALAANDDKALRAVLERLDRKSGDEGALEVLLSDELSELMGRVAPRTNLSAYHRELEAIVDRSAASYGAWYELFPRSASGAPGRHSTFDDAIARLPYVREMGFDVLYLPPIHPIGRTNRKGQNNSLEAAPGDPGSPWAIGASEGGHTAINPELGSFDDFERLLAAARREGIEVALDFAIQCSPDHPWIKEHPEWFDWRPDGTIKFAENPPKKYQDIVNVHFYRGALPSLWYALRDVVLFWIERGVRIFRVDNPHTKPVPFWEWLIGEVQDKHPDTVFLSEAFTRPKMMHKLAKIGFSQSYTYFTWRNTKAELTGYLTELTQTAAREYFRPNFFVNTPDINPPFLQTGGRSAFRIRATLAATLSSLWGIYSGFELCEATPIPGREEYLNSEKYEIKAWDWDRPGNIRDTIARLNRIRRTNPALHRNDTLRFYTAHSEQILFYGKTSSGRDNIVWVVVNLDRHNAREATIELPLGDLHLGDDAELEVEELFSGDRFRWRGRTQWIRLDPERNPCAIWRITPPALG